MLDNSFSCFRAFVIVFLSLAVCLLTFTHNTQAAGTTTQPGLLSEGLSVRQYGALGDGKAKDTEAIQRAIDVAGAAGGGTVRFPPGVYLSGTLVLKSGVTLMIEAGATLLGSTELGDFPCLTPSVRSYTDNYTCRSLIYGDSLHDVAIVGHGIIDGQGAAYKNPAYMIRPYNIRLVACRGVRVEGVTLRNSPMWMQHYLACEDLIVRGIRVFNHVNANNDMIDIDGCRNVCVSDCLGDSDDDALTLKSTSAHACENVAVANCVLSSHCSAIKFGTESNGGFQNITISNCTIHPSRAETGPLAGTKGLAGIALELVDGGLLERVAISNIAIQGTKAPLFLRLGNRARPFKKGDEKPGMGSFRNVTISGIVATEADPIGCSITGLPGHAIENVTLSDVRIGFMGGGKRADPTGEVPERPEVYPECTMFGVLPAYGLYCRHVKGLTLRNVEVGWAQRDDRPALVCDDVADLDVDAFRGMCSSDSPAVMVLDEVRGATIRGCRVPPDVKAFLRLEGASQKINVFSNDLSGLRSPFVFGANVPPAAVFQSGNRLAE